MDRKHQMGLLLGTVRDYQNGLMPLGMLVDKVEGILDIVQDRAIKDNFFDVLLVLEEVYARIQNENFDFEKDGRPVVDRALKEMLTKTEAFLAPSV